MIRYIEFPPEQTAEILERLIVAGKGAVLRIVPDGTEDGMAVKFSAAVRTAEEKEAEATDDECDPNVNKSTLCPPVC